MTAMELVTQSRTSCEEEAADWAARGWKHVDGYNAEDPSTWHLAGWKTYERKEEDDETEHGKVKSAEQEPEPDSLCCTFASATTDVEAALASTLLALEQEKEEKKKYDSNFDCFYGSYNDFYAPQDYDDLYQYSWNNNKYGYDFWNWDEEHHNKDNQYNWWNEDDESSANASAASEEHYDPENPNTWHLNGWRWTMQKDAECDAHQEQAPVEQDDEDQLDAEDDSDDWSGFMSANKFFWEQDDDENEQQENTKWGGHSYKYNVESSTQTDNVEQCIDITDDENKSSDDQENVMTIEQLADWLSAGWKFHSEDRSCDESESFDGKNADSTTRVATSQELADWLAAGWKFYKNEEDYEPAEASDVAEWLSNGWKFYSKKMKEDDEQQPEEEKDAAWTTDEDEYHYKNEQREDDYYHSSWSWSAEPDSAHFDWWNSSASSDYKKSHTYFCDAESQTFHEPTEEEIADWEQTGAQWYKDVAEATYGEPPKSDTERADWECVGWKFYDEWEAAGWKFFEDKNADEDDDFIFCEEAPEDDEAEEFELLDDDELAYCSAA
ncbi:unnamed protein product [Amoebophrya sp. A120]|nr:unnamed protein product [Amoebophrya sp. A120]|eukprot:GSA120T00004275001.1